MLDEMMQVLCFMTLSYHCSICTSIPSAFPAPLDSDGLKQRKLCCNVGMPTCQEREEVGWVARPARRCSFQVALISAGAGASKEGFLRSEAQPHANAAGGTTWPIGCYREFSERLCGIHTHSDLKVAVDRMQH